MADELFDIAQAAVAPLGLEVVDVELRAKLARIVIDRPGGVDLDTIATATRAVSTALDEHDPFPGRYTLEVSSPGVERPLRTRRHFAAAVGEVVSVRLAAGVAGDRRLEGRLVSADDEGILLAPGDGDGGDGGAGDGDRPAPPAGADDPATGARRIPYGEIERARTVFAWGAAGPGRAGSQRQSGRGGPGPRNRNRVTTP